MTSADMLVIGGGAIGLSIAWRAAERGARVTLVERAELGRESSWAAAGILPYSRVDRVNTAYERAMADSARLHRDHAAQLREETGIDVGYVVCGEILAALSAADRGGWQQEVSRQRAAGASVVQVDPRAYGLGAEVVEAQRITETAQIRPPRYLRALEAAARGRGARIEIGTPIAELVREGDRVVGARAESGAVFRAGVTVVAAGAWSPALAGALPVRPIRGQIALLRLLTPLEPTIVSAAHEYVVPRLDGHVLVGATMEDAGFDRRTTATGIQHLLTLAVRLVPALAGAEVVRAWAGLRPATPSGEPIIGPAPDTRGLWIATGHTRQGIHLAPHTGERVAAEALSG